MTQRSKAEASRANAQGSTQEDPRVRTGGRARGSHPALAGSLRNGDTPPSAETPSLPVLPPLPATDPVTGRPIPTVDEPAHYKGLPLHMIGRDKGGRVIPHKRNEGVAKKIKGWVAGGYNINDIAIALNIRPGLIKQHYSTEIAMGLELVGMDMTSHILKRAKASDRMAIFFAKARLGWRDGDAKPLETGLLNIHIHN